MWLFFSCCFSDSCQGNLKLIYNKISFCILGEMLACFCSPSIGNCVLIWRNGLSVKLYSSVVPSLLFSFSHPSLFSCSGFLLGAVCQGENICPHRWGPQPSDGCGQPRPLLGVRRPSSVFLPPLFSSLLSHPSTLFSLSFFFFSFRFNCVLGFIDYREYECLKKKTKMGI